MINLEHCDINAVEHCNLRCAACSHVAPFSKAWFLSTDDLRRDLASIKDVLHFKQGCFVGGEPTLHPCLSDLLDVARVSGVFDELVVITNGRLIKKLEMDFWSALRTESNVSGALRLSVYPNLDPALAQYAEKMCETHNVRFESISYSEFYKQLKRVPDDGVDTFKNCHWKSNCFTIHQGKFYLCPQSVFFPKLFGELVPGADGIALNGLSEDALNAFLNRKDPLAACQHCCGGHNETIPWKESRNRAEWVDDSTLK